MKSLVFLAVGMFTMGCSSYVIAGLLSGISSTLNSSIAATGQGITAFGLTYALCAPVFAVILAGKPARLILLIALTVFSLGSLITLLSQNLPLYLLGRGIAGIGTGLYTPVCVAVAIHLAGPSARGRALSFIWGANSAGAVIGVPAGLWLAEKFSWHASILLILILGLTALFGIIFRKVDLQAKAPASLRQRLLHLADQNVLSIIAVTFLTAAGSLGLYAYITAVHDKSSNSLTLALFLWSLGGLLGSSSVGHFIDKTGRPRSVMAGILLFLIIAILLLPLLNSIPVLGLMPFFIWGGMGWATVTPQQHTLIGLQPEQSATLAALNGTALSLGGVFGAAVAGFSIANGFDAKNLPYAASSVLFLALIWQLFLIKRSSLEVTA